MRMSEEEVKKHIIAARKRKSIEKPPLPVDKIVSNRAEKTDAFTKERYDEIVKRADKMGIKILTKWRKGLKNIIVAPIVLDEW